MELKRKEELTQEAKNFFEVYKSKVIGTSARERENVVYLPFSYLAEFSPDLAEEVLQKPSETIALLEDALAQLEIQKNPRIRLTSLPETAQLKVRHIRAKHLDQLLWIEGIVRQASDVRPQVVNARFECPTCGAILSVLQIDRKFNEPSRCSCGRKGQFKLLSKEMVDAQRIVIEESPDSLDGGEQPKRMNVFLQEDLVEPRLEERTTPGSRIRVFGVLKEVPVPLQTGAISTRFDLAIEANNIIPMEETFADLKISEEDEKQIRELAADPLIYKKLSKSISPSVYGIDDVKEALMLQLFSGIRKKKSDGGQTRGNIHILLVGDPGVAKSVTLKFISRIAPKGRYVSGKATTGAGLTAAVIKDEFLKGWSLEAGAMVLANKGTVCVDEIEKMDEHDRSTMHEAMEQQCYHYETPITLANGEEIKIGELVEGLFEKNKEKIIEGKDCLILPYNELEILTTDFKKVYKTKVDRISKHKAFNRFVKIKFSHGREIKVTPEHPIFTVENGKIITKRADTVKIGDPIPIPLNAPIPGEEQILERIERNPRAKQHARLPEKNGPALFKIVGYLIAEGSREKNRGKVIGVNFTNSDKRVLDDFEEAMKTTFNLTPYKQLKVDEHAPRYMYRYTSRELAEFFIRNMPEILKTSGEKSIPKFALRGRKEDIARMLSALFEGDGYATIKERTIRIGYKTKSKQLASQIQDLLLRFKIRSSITENRGFYRVGITEYTNIQRFQEEIKFVTPEKNQIIENYLKEKTIKRFVKNRVPQEFNQRIMEIIEKEGIKHVGKYSSYDIKYDHIKRKEAFCFSTPFLQQLAIQVKQKESKEFLETLIGEIGWESVIGIEIVPNEEEKWVYDVTIEPTHAFISQATILHNTVTISKANIQATLRAETSVLAAGNPKLGRFDPFTPIPQQIDISPALLSRFDVIFVLRDIPNKTQDEAIATYVLEEHQQEVIREVIEPELLRKYIAYAQKCKPRLSDEAVAEIKRFNVRLRNQSVSSDKDIKPIPITARQLEAIVRLSEACARVRLSDTVVSADAKRAIELLQRSLRQVGYDEDTKTFDIDRITTGITSSRRGKIIAVREAIAKLESRIGKLIPVEEIEREVGEKVTKMEIEDAISELKKKGDIFEPKHGFIQITT